MECCIIFRQTGDKSGMAASAKLIGDSAANQHGLEPRSFLTNQVADSNPAKRLFVRDNRYSLGYGKYDTSNTVPGFLSIHWSEVGRSTIVNKYIMSCKSIRECLLKLSAMHLSH